MKKLLLITVFSLIAILSAFSQTYNIDAYHNQTITTCSGTIYDSGGTGYYFNGEDYSVTVTTATPGLQVKLVINYNTEATYDYLKIYDGITTTTLITTLSGSGNYTVTSNNPNGSLVLVWHSDGSVAYDGFSAVISCPAPMTYLSSQVFQPNTANVNPTATNQEVIQVQVATDGTISPINATSFSFNTTGTTNPVSDIQNAKVWSTGTNSLFSATTQIGTTTISPNGSFTITGSHTLATGINYFWLTYDIKPGAINGNVIDAECTSITVNGTPYAPSTPAPTGTRPIVIVTWNGTFETAASFIANGMLAVNGTQTNKWIVGTATSNGGVNSAYISNNGSANTYTNTATSRSYFYFDYYFPISNPLINLSYKWKCNGETSFDYLKMYIVETTVTPVAGAAAGLSPYLFATPLQSGFTTWQTASYSLSSTYAGTTKRIVFEWKNDANTGTNPPAAVDNIIITTTNINTCVNAAPISVNLACAFETFSNSGATPSYEINGSCGDDNVNDVWVKFVVPTTGSIEIETRANQVTDGVMALYSGACGTLTEIACDDNSGTGNMPFITISGRTVGETIWVRFWETGNLTSGNFDICIKELPIPTVQDCLGAITICENTYSEVNAYSGTGNILNEISPGNSCLGSGEKNDVWYLFTAQQTDPTVEFSITPNVLTDDYDWAIFDLTNASCEDIYTNAALEISCNYSADDGTTGTSTSGVYSSQDEFGSLWNRPISVVDGGVYLINVSQYSTSINGYTIDFSYSSSTIVDNSGPTLYRITSSPSCGENQIIFDFSERILATSVDATDITITGPGGTYNIISIVGNSNTGFDRSFTITLDQALTAGGTYTMTMNGSVEDACNNTTLSSSLQFIVNGLAASVVVNQDETCPGSLDGQATASTIGGTPPYSYLWSNGANTNVASNLGNGSYYVTVTDNLGVCEDVQLVEITTIPSLGITGSINGSNLVCDGVTGEVYSIVAVANATDYTWTVPSGATFAGNGTTSITVNWGTSTGGDITVTPKNICEDGTTETLAVTITPTIVSGPISGLDTVCVGNPNGIYSIDAIADATGYVWTVPAGTSINSGQGTTSIDIAWGTSVGGNIIITPSNSCGAGIADTLTVLVYEQPIANAGTGGDECDLNFVFNATPSAGIGTWTKTAGLGTASFVNANSATTTVTVSSYGTYDFTWTEDNNSCTDNASITVNFYQQPTAVLDDSTNICTGQVLILDAENIGSDYLWSTGETTQTINASTNDTYIVTIDNNGCITVDSTVITVTNSVSLDLGIDTLICTGTTLILNAENNGATFLWSTGDITRTISTDTAGTYSVFVITGVGCEGRDTIVIGLNPLPIVNIGNDTSFCSTQSLILDAENAGSSYLWNTNESTQTITVNTSGDYSVAVTDINLCVNYDTLTINVINQPVLVLPESTNICFGDSLTLDAGNIGYDFTWNTNETTQTIVADAAGLYTVLIDNNGCTEIDSSVVTISNFVAVNLGIDTAICFGETLNLDAENIGSTYLWNTGETTQTISTDTAGIYFVEVTTDLGCVGRDSISLTINQLPIVDLGIDTSFCANQTYTFDAGNLGSTYLWNSGETSQTITTNISGEYIVVVTDANLCSQTDSVILNTIAIQIADFTSVIQPQICGMPDGIINVTDSINYTYAWNSSSSDSSSATNLSGGYYDVTITSVENCSIVLDTTLTDPTEALVFLDANNDSICQGKMITFTANGISSGSYSFLVNGLLITSGTTNSFSTNTLNDGDYITLVGADNNGCTGRDSIQVSVLPVPQPVITGDTLACVSSQDVYSVTSASNLIYTWGVTGGGAISSGAGTESINVNWTLPGTYDITITEDITGYVGCESSGSYSVIVSPEAPELNINNPAPTCSTVVDLTNSAVTTGSFNVVNLEYLLNMTPPIVLTDPVNVGLTGTYYIVAINGCGTDTMPVVVHINDAVPIIFATDTMMACINATNNTIDITDPSITVGSTNVINFEYWEDYARTTAITNPSAISETGIYYISASNGCAPDDIEPISIFISDSILLVITDPNAVCYPGTVNLTDPAIISGSQEIVYTYYLNEDGTTISNPTEIGVSGTYFIEAINGCGSDNMPVNVYINDAAPDLQVRDTMMECSPNTIDLETGILPSSTNLVYISYWTDATATTEITNPNTINTSGIYYILATNGCEPGDMESTSVFINDTLPNLIVNDIAPVCFGESVDIGNSSIIDNSTGVVYIYYYDRDTTLLSNTIVDESGNYFVEAINGCDTILRPIIVQINEPIQISADTTSPSCEIGQDGRIIAIAQNGEGNYTYNWNIISSNDSILVNIEGGEYYLTVTDSLGCSAIDTIYLVSKDIECLEIPTAFTPNNDGVNDDWSFKNIYLYPNTKVEIFNRWGSLIFTSNDYRNKVWDGKYNGKDVPTGSYIFIITLSNGTDPINGVVTIIR